MGILIKSSFTGNLVYSTKIQRQKFNDMFQSKKILKGFFGNALYEPGQLLLFYNLCYSFAISSEFVCITAEGLRYFKYSSILFSFFTQVF